MEFSTGWQAAGVAVARGKSRSLERDWGAARSVCGRAAGGENGRNGQWAKAEQTRAVACGAREAGGYRSGVGRGGSRSHRVSRREPANDDQMAALTMRADRRFG